MNHRFADSILDATTAPFRDWLANHPIVFWLVTHPLWLLGSLLLLLFFLSGLLGAVSQLTQNLWLAILNFPVRLSQWIWSRTFGLVRAIALPSPPTSGSSPSQTRLTDILNRLDALQQEQDALLQELRTLLNKDS